MNFVAINWLNISINLLLVAFVVVCLLMTLVILMQRPKQEGLGAAFGGGLTDQVFGARTTNVLQRGTVYMASLFFVLALALAVLFARKNRTVSLQETSPPPAATAPAETPAQPQPKSLSEQLPPEDKSTPSTETAPVTPENPAPEATPGDTPADSSTPSTPPTDATPAPAPAAPGTAPAPEAPPAPGAETNAAGGTPSQP